MKFSFSLFQQNQLAKDHSKNQVETLLELYFFDCKKNRKINKFEAVVIVVDVVVVVVAVVDVAVVVFWL
jgi:hypothetical protein